MLSSWLSFVFSSLLILSTAAYEVPVSDKDYDRQICSGMWANQKTFINVTFDSSAQGQLAMVVYEWGDMAYLGKVTSPETDRPQKTYVCTSDAVKGGLCENSQLGRFILDLPTGKVSFQGGSSSLPASSDASNYTTPWRRDIQLLDERDALNPSPSGILLYQQPIQYQVRKIGYYCVAIVPVSVMPSSARQAGADVPYHPTYTGTVFFRNTFDGPFVQFYFIMFLVYTVVAVGWGWLCYRNLQDLLPIQYYLSSLLGFLIIEMVANWAYYRYLNAHGRGTPSTVFLIVVAILDAGRNALSFFLLLIVSLGLSVVRESLGKTMIKCQALAVAHFIFGVLYAVGIVELELESTSALVLLLFVVPLAFTLSGFLLWILYALNTTIAQLASRKQHYKLYMFKTLHRILLLTVLVIAIFFVVSSLTFSGRLAEDYGARSWRVQWWLLDGWLALLYLLDFVAIAYLWRPSPNNSR
ncbi:protein PTM1 [Fomitopsis serialis]|uniref:protein PTM1 n=1 Tax=Fomitopsis serialis TaxID=139415 RepID=UPI00200826EE|nr:protein PTM1 [Neoantrodia serialis]KAH9937302.1 protein PTM1 [Neoantrodia serialis]